MSLWILIDGYNLIGQSPVFGPLGHRDMEEARIALIDSLRRYKKVKGCRITVAFDGSRTWGANHSEKNNQGIEILFSRKGEQADDVIKRMADQWRDALVVVTSDREVAHVSERAGATVVESREFEGKMEMALYEDLKAVEEDMEEDHPPKHYTRKKGPPKRSSKIKRRTHMRLRKL